MQSQYNIEVLKQLKKDVRESHEDFCQRIDALIEMTEKTFICQTCKAKPNQSTPTFTKEGAAFLCATDGALKNYQGFKRGSYSVAFAIDHPLNTARVTNMLPVIFIQELEGIELALEISQRHELWPLIILVDNQTAMTLAECILHQDRNDFLDLSKNRSEVAELLERIASYKTRDIKFKHIHSHTGIPTTNMKLNSVADRIANQILEVTYETAAEAEVIAKLEDKYMYKGIIFCINFTRKNYFSEKKK